LLCSRRYDPPATFYPWLTVFGPKQDEGRYSQFLSSIILQGFLALLEPEVVVVARPKDKTIVEKAIQDATEQYKNISGRDVKGTVDTGLDDESCVMTSTDIRELLMLTMHGPDPAA
jgi:hypothetical protein